MGEHLLGCREHRALPLGRTGVRAAATGAWAAEAKRSRVTSLAVLPHVDDARLVEERLSCMAAARGARARGAGRTWDGRRRDKRLLRLDARRLGEASWGANAFQLRLLNHCVKRYEHSPA